MDLLGWRGSTRNNNEVKDFEKKLGARIFGKLKWEGRSEKWKGDSGLKS